MYSCTNTLEQFDHNPSCFGKTHLMVFFIDIWLCLPNSVQTEKNKAKIIFCLKITKVAPLM